MNNQPSFGYVIGGLVLMALLFFGGMWVGVWVDDKKNTPDAPDPDSPELLRLMHLARIMQKVQDSIHANNGLMVAPIGTSYDDETGEFSNEFSDEFS